MQKNILDDIIFIQYLIKKLYKDFEVEGLNHKLNTTQLWVLAIMSKYEKITMTEICRLVVLEKGSFKTTIDLLDSYGYLNSEKAEDDRRKIYLSLTPQGKKEAERITLCLEEYLHKRFASLDEYTRQNILNALRILAQYAKEVL